MEYLQIINFNYMRKMRNIRIVGTQARNIGLNLENTSHMKRCLLTLLILLVSYVFCSYLWQRSVQF